MSEKIKQLAKMIVEDAIQVKEKEKVFISYQGYEAKDLVLALKKEIHKKGAFGYAELTDDVINTFEKKNLTDFDISCLKELEEKKMDFFDSIIFVRYSFNDYELKDMNDVDRKKLEQALQKALDIRVNHRKWVLLKYPSPLDAYKAKMSYEDFMEFSLDAMLVDYQKMREDIKPLKELMEKTDKVRITGKNTELTFSIKGMPAIPCLGEKNIPDGECYTAPVKDSVNGTITYNTESPYHGEVFSNVSLTFQDGKIISATCDGDDRLLNRIFDSDEGARYVGEFSLGVNPQVLTPMGDILFDEKIYGSIHFTPGCCYDDCDNGNKSTVHWDLVLIQREEYGGGEIYFDDVLIRKDGEFVLDSLKQLNREKV